MPEMNQIPGDPEIWLVDGQIWIVYLYDLPDVEGEIPVAFYSSEANLKKAMGGNKITYDRTLTNKQFNQVGALDMGNATALAEFEYDPITEWEDNFANQAKVRPWLNDMEVASVFLGAYLEGREPDAAEFENTEWWRTHNQAQRDWMLTASSDPATAAQMRSDARIQIRDQLIAAGVAKPDPELVGWLTEKFITGDWSETYVSGQVRKLSDPYAPGKMNKELQKFIKGDKVDKTQDMEDKVKELADQWLGPKHGKMQRRQLERWAGKLRNDPDGEQELVERLRARRMTLFAGYTDPNTTYDDIASLWANDWVDILGQTPDEVGDAAWMKAIRMNDVEEFGKYVTRTGIQRGNEHLLKQARNDIMQTFGPERNPY